MSARRETRSPSASTASPWAARGDDRSRRGGAGGWPGPLRAWPRPLQHHRYLILLSLLICAVLFQSIERRPVGIAVATELLVALSLLVMTLVVFERRRSRLVALGFWAVLGILTLALYLAPTSGRSWLSVPQYALMMVFHGWATALILRNVFEGTRIGTDDVLGAVCGYLLAAGAWANLYTLLDALLPGSFAVNPQLAGQFPEDGTRHALFIYYSLVTMTSVGYGDVAPIRGPITALAVFEMVFGQFYIAVVVAQLVGIRLAQGMRDRGD